jgi:hypothetical protein
MWEGDITDEAEMEDWAAAIGWHSSNSLSSESSSRSSTTASSTTDNRGRWSASPEPQRFMKTTTTATMAMRNLPNQPWAIDGGCFDEGWLLQLPEELQLEVLSWLGPRELATLNAVCRQLRDLVSGERSLRRSLVGLPERYLVFRPRIPLADLEQPSPTHQGLGTCLTIIRVVTIIISSVSMGACSRVCTQCWSTCVRRASSLCRSTPRTHRW